MKSSFTQKIILYKGEPAIIIPDEIIKASGVQEGDSITYMISKLPHKQ